jgi:hypothetical protein
MTKTEIETIENVIRCLKGGRDGAKVRSSPSITEKLISDDMRLWLDTWVIGALECLLPGDGRDPRLAVKLSR